MNSLAHLLVSYAIASHLTSDPPIILLAVALGLLPDLDHLSHLGKAAKTGRFGSESRSWLHEFYGLCAMSVVVMLLPKDYFAPLFFSTLSHYLLDFLTRETRPFYPETKNEIFLRLYPKSLKPRTVADIILTGGILLWIML